MDTPFPVEHILDLFCSIVVIKALDVHVCVKKLYEYLRLSKFKLSHNDIQFYLILSYYS